MKTENYYLGLFIIQNTEGFSGEYLLFEIQGLIKQQKGFQKNRQNIINRLSRTLRHPITIIERAGKQYLVTKNEDKISAELPVEFPKIGGGKVFFHRTEHKIKIDFNSSDKWEQQICERFLQFEFNGSLYQDKNLWQPGAGQPFYFKKPQRFKGTDIFTGFKVRIVYLKGKWGVGIDVTKKMIRATPLPAHLSAEEFYNHHKGKHYLYKYGNSWYTTPLVDFETTPVNQYSYIKNDGREVNLLEELRYVTSRPHPKHLANLPEDGSVLLYYSSTGEQRAAAAGLCFEVLGADNQAHRETIIPPHIRTKLTKRFRDQHLRNLMYGIQKVILSPKMYQIDLSVFAQPDIILGDNLTVSVKKHLSAKEWAKHRMRLLRDPHAGFYKSDNTNLPPQYIFLPRSIFDTAGKIFVEKLVAEVKTLYPWFEYKPTVKYYEDKFTDNRNYVRVGKRIVETVSKINTSGLMPHVLIMTPDFRRGNSKHDELAALVVQELNAKQINCSIIHNSMVRNSFYERVGKDGFTTYYINQNNLGGLRGYLTNTAINKILLANGKYPYVLKNPLHTDMVIGIDVKNNLAGFVFIDKYAKNLKKVLKKVNKREKLSKELILKVLIENLKQEANFVDYPLLNFTFHRDGRFFDTEMEGIATAFEILKKKGIIAPEAVYTLVEIPKSPPLTLRFIGHYFNKEYQKRNYRNPTNGSYWMASENEGYLCTTGREFHRGGTSKPLMVRKVEGEQKLVVVLQDIFYLSSLAYTKPDGCSRVPMSIKMLDVHLRDAGASYQQSAYQNLLNYEDY